MCLCSDILHPKDELLIVFRTTVGLLYDGILVKQKFLSFLDFSSIVQSIKKVSQLRADAVLFNDSLVGDLLVAIKRTHTAIVNNGLVA